MTRTETRCRCAAVALLFAPWVSIAAPAAWQPTPAACPLEVIGTWKLSTANESDLSFLTFSADGWVNVLSAHGAAAPGGLDIIAQVRYDLAPRREPRRIEFQTRQGNDVFPAGTSNWEIITHTDESFTARRVYAEGSEPSLWTRVQTHRYFLTFASRGGTAPERAGDAAAFVMWTTLDGQKTELEALGATAQGARVRFGLIPNEFARTFATQSKRNDDVMMRIELSEAEYRRTHQVFEAWNSLLGGDRLARDDPEGQAMELLQATVQSANRCGVRIRLTEANSIVAADNSKKANLLRRPVELVTTIRRVNDRTHVHDKLFPFQWKPTPST